MQPMNLYLATTNGLVICVHDGAAWVVSARALEGRRLTSVIAREGVILAGGVDGIVRSDDEGRTWRDANSGLTTRYVRWLAYHPDMSDREFAGTEPAAIFVSHDGADTWRECAEVAQLRDTYGWFLPYSSNAGCIRGFAFQANRAYAAAEVGGALRSDDGGETWRLCVGSAGDPDLAAPPEGTVYPDVHSIAVHPSSPELVYAPTGGGFYRSVDGGATWTLLYDCYARAIWLDPHDADHMILGPADNVDSHGRIEETRDGGQTWHLAAQGLDVPWQRHMVERFTQIGAELFAVLSTGHLLCASLATLEWTQVAPEVRRVTAITTMQA
jgi:photosystem II stability/assembly factor-like uncharacterized protein